jgi:hypothetical protein
MTPMRVLILAAFAIALAMPVKADDRPVGRYIVTPFWNSFLYSDTATGRVDFCMVDKLRGTAAICTVVIANRQAVADQDGNGPGEVIDHSGDQYWKPPQ